MLHTHTHIYNKYAIVLGVGGGTSPLLHPQLFHPFFPPEMFGPDKTMQFVVVFSAESCVHTYIILGPFSSLFYFSLHARHI